MIARADLPRVGLRIAVQLWPHFGLDGDDRGDRHAENAGSDVYANANKETRWLSTPAYADLVSGGADGAPPSERAISAAAS